LEFSSEFGNDGSVYPKFQQSTHAILPPMRLRGECGGLAGNVTAQKEKAHSAYLQLEMKNLLPSEMLKPRVQDAEAG